MKSHSVERLLLNLLLTYLLTYLLTIKEDKKKENILCSEELL